MKKLSALLVSLTVALLICEFTISSYFKVPAFAPNVFDLNIGWKPRPNATGWNLESSEKVTKGPLGWHDRLIGKTRPACTLNFFGDSFLEGAQFPPQDNFSSILETRLIAQNFCESVYVNNFGLSGTGTLQQARLLQEKGGTYPANHSALFMFLGNDIQNNLFARNDGLAPGFSGFPNEHRVVEATYRNSNVRKTLRNILAPITDASSTIRLLAITLLGNHRSVTGASPSALIPDNLRGINVNRERFEWEMEALRLSLEQASDNAKKIKTELTVFILPTGREIAFGDTKEVTKIKKKITNWCDDFRISCHDVYKELKKRNGSFYGSKFHLSIDGHLNKEGHLEISDILYRFYTPKIKKSLK